MTVVAEADLAAAAGGGRGAARSTWRAGCPVRARLLALGAEDARAGGGAAPHRRGRLVDRRCWPATSRPAYAARREGRAPGWAPLPVQYADYALWQRELLGDEDDPGSVLAAQMAYWREALAGVPRSWRCRRTGRARPWPATAAHACAAADPGGRCTPQLAALARERGVTLFMVLQAALAVLLSKLGAGTDIPIGTPVAGRTDEALDDLVGFFVNTLVVRTDLSADPGFADLLGRVREAGLGAFAHQDVPFEKLVDVLVPARSLARNALFQVMLAVQNTARSAVTLPGLRVGTLPANSDSPAVRFDLDVVITESFGEDRRPRGLRGTITAAADLFAPATVAMIAHRFLTVLRAVVADPQVRLHRVEVLSTAERAQVLSGWNDTGVAEAAGLVPDLVMTQAGRCPDAVAVTCGDAAVSYGTWWRRRGGWAGLLAGLGVGPGSVVAVVMDRGPDLVAVLLGTWLAGAAYLPVDPSYPPARIGSMLADAAPACVITAPGRAAMLPASCPVPVFSGRPGPAGAPAVLPVLPAVRAGDAAYVIYTSGSTGAPKGVVVPHASVAALLAAAAGRLGAGPELVWSWFHSPAFDVSVWEVWGALAHGGRLVRGAARDLAGAGPARCPAGPPAGERAEPDPVSVLRAGCRAGAGRGSGAVGGLRRGGPAGGAAGGVGGPVPGGAAGEPVRDHGDHGACDVAAGRAGRDRGGRQPGGAGAGGVAGVRAGRVAVPGAAGGGRGGVRGRGRAGPRVPGAGGADRGAVRGVPVRAARGRGCTAPGTWPGGPRTVSWHLPAAPMTRSRSAATGSSPARSRPSWPPAPAWPGRW